MTGIKTVIDFERFADIVPRRGSFRRGNEKPPYKLSLVRHTTRNCECFSIKKKN